MSRTVAVIGGGYGGSALAKALVAETEVVHIDPGDAFVNTAGSLRTLTRPDWGSNIFFPYAEFLTRGTVVRVQAETVVQYKGADLFTGRFAEQFGSA
ncbi:hypothetical protein [Streptosporangium sp. NBC_01756]|uniref:hypothetical protein n=1 Tax=Streptosporangium sp. NBC_01756 TaxID=2975950 RepID=UPI002DDBFD35|nr:hypothetical protein [Streptosporangium sp. NBC_01756]WSC88892.1 hypothetical protein OIE48_12115 [Streptosporangium sp. NBC_01756]